jgi:hypothetical protein
MLFCYDNQKSNYFFKKAKKNKKDRICEKKRGNQRN